MRHDWVERVVEGWSGLGPEVDMEPYLVTGRISRIAARVARRQEEAFAPYGLNRGEVGVLSTLRTAGPASRLSPTQLFRELMLSSGGMTSRLDRLERRGLVRRTADPADRRGILVELTDEGRRLVDEAVTANLEQERRLLAGLGPGETTALARLLRKLLAQLEP